ncbi:hypothetical protein SELMODRAFT_422886 [Selaginella moellendorffii]|uniref:Uncharacterized protein n=1 Tax=Selaginella moellendorffii TaxID=88036 RepID=D8SJV6_SELML|nr:hypothetical protein SELMODRAFT_422886 [Selaginella moellendorffii]
MANLIKKTNLQSAFKQIKIDYVIGESEKEWVPGRPGPVALLRMFGVNAVSFTDKNARSKQKQQDSHFVTNIEMVHKRSLMYFQSQKARAFLGDLALGLFASNSLFARCMCPEVAFAESIAGETIVHEAKLCSAALLSRDVRASSGLVKHEEQELWHQCPHSKTQGSNTAELGVIEQIVLEDDGFVESWMWTSWGEGAIGNDLAGPMSVATEIRSFSLFTTAQCSTL